MGWSVLHVEGNLIVWISYAPTYIIPACICCLDEIWLRRTERRNVKAWILKALCQWLIANVEHSLVSREAWNSYVTYLEVYHEALCIELLDVALVPENHYTVVGFNKLGLKINNRLWATHIDAWPWFYELALAIL